jgi:hypothetical protein
LEEEKMVIYVSELGSDRTELIEVLIKEGVTYQECPAGRDKELGSPLLEIQANLPEVFPVPPRYVQSEGDVRLAAAFRRLIITICRAT